MRPRQEKRQKSVMKIPKLKPNSAEFDDGQREREKKTRRCDKNGCHQEGLYKAPKSPQKLKEFMFFCLEHVREHNGQWNYFEDFSTDELEEYLRSSSSWDRPTWKAGINSFMESRLKQRIYEQFTQGERTKFRFKFGGDKDEKDEDNKKNRSYNTLYGQKDTPEAQALEVLEIKPPTDFDKIKKIYKQMVKKHHPDLNAGDPESEEKIKKINAAYTILKVAYSRYEKIKDKY